jgi:hypothetical protein
VEWEVNKKDNTPFVILTSTKTDSLCRNNFCEPNLSTINLTDSLTYCVTWTVGNCVDILIPIVKRWWIQYDNCCTVIVDLTAATLNNYPKWTVNRAVVILCWTFGCHTLFLYYKQASGLLAPALSVWNRRHISVFKFVVVFIFAFYSAKYCSRSCLLLKQTWDMFYCTCWQVLTDAISKYSRNLITISVPQILRTSPFKPYYFLRYIFICPSPFVFWANQLTFSEMILS